MRLCPVPWYLVMLLLLLRRRRRRHMAPLGSDAAPQGIGRVETYLVRDGLGHAGAVARMRRRAQDLDEVRRDGPDRPRRRHMR